MRRSTTRWIAAVACLACWAGDAKARQVPQHGAATGQDRSGRHIRGQASVYHPRFAGRRMADQTRYDPRSNVAASKTLPLGTEAKVTNLDNGRTSTVRVADRGPYVKGRVIDLSTSTAADLGITRKEGVAPVEVAPIAVPQPDGTVKTEPPP